LDCPTQPIYLHELTAEAKGRLMPLTKPSAAPQNTPQANEQNQTLRAEYEICDREVTEARKRLDEALAERSDVVRRIVQANNGLNGPYYFNGASYRATKKPVRNAANQPNGDVIWYFRQYYDPKRAIDLDRHLTPFYPTD